MPAPLQIERRGHPGSRFIAGVIVGFTLGALMVSVAVLFGGC